jgi:hypothetical protein
MKSLLAAAAALGALAIAVPAHADPRQPGRGYEQPAAAHEAYRGDGRDDLRGGYYDRQPGDYRANAIRGFSRGDLARLSERIDWGFQSGRLTEREARRLSWQLSDLRQRARYYWRTEGVSWRERRDLDMRYFALRDAIRYQMHDDDRRFDDRRYDDRRSDDGYRGAPPPRRY